METFAEHLHYLFMFHDVFLFYLLHSRCKTSTNSDKQRKMSDESHKVFDIFVYNAFSLLLLFFFGRCRQRWLKAETVISLN